MANNNSPGAHSWVVSSPTAAAAAAAAAAQPRLVRPTSGGSNNPEEVSGRSGQYRLGAEIPGQICAPGAMRIH